MIRLLVLLAAIAGIGAVQAQDATLIRGARVFDGSGKPAKVEDVLIRGDRIAAVGKRVRLPAGARQIDAAGLTLMPGLHDLHIHTPQAAVQSVEALEKAYAPYLADGITAVNEYSVSGEMLAGIRALEAGAVVPHINLAIRLGVPGGHGTESAFTDSITTKVTTAAEAHAAMARLLPFKPDVIKVFADGWRYGDPGRTDRASMDLPTLAAIVKDAHRAGVEVVTHTVSLAGAKIAARAGVDTLMHGVGDFPVDDELISLMRRHRTAYVSTLVVYEPQETRVLSAVELARLSPEDRAIEEARTPRQVPDWDAKRWAVLQDNIRRLKAAGVRIGVGTDTGIDGVYPGVAALREMMWFTRLGFTPAEALKAGTSVSADIMGAGREHGRIKRGQRADLVLTGGRPDERFEDVYDVRRVFVRGREVAAKMP